MTVTLDRLMALLLLGPSCNQTGDLESGEPMLYIAVCVQSYHHCTDTLYKHMLSIGSWWEVWLALYISQQYWNWHSDDTLWLVWSWPALCSFWKLVYILSDGICTCFIIHICHVILWTTGNDVLTSTLTTLTPCNWHHWDRDDRLHTLSSLDSPYPAQAAHTRYLHIGNCLPSIIIYPVCHWLVWYLDAIEMSLSCCTNRYDGDLLHTHSTWPWTCLCDWADVNMICTVLFECPMPSIVAVL